MQAREEEAQIWAQATGKKQEGQHRGKELTVTSQRRASLNWRRKYVGIGQDGRELAEKVMKGEG